MVYDITGPRDAQFVQYRNNRNFEVPACIVDAVNACAASNPAAGDLGPEGLHFVPWYFSPKFKPLLLVGNEVSGTTSVFQVNIAE
jgi:hypothetical protein